MTVDRNRPFLNGRTFDDTYGMQDSVKIELCYAGMVFVTTFREGRKDYGGVIIARDLNHARIRADERDLGEVVNGPLEAYGRIED